MQRKSYVVCNNYRTFPILFIFYSNQHHQYKLIVDKTILDRYGHLMPNLKNDAARRLDKTVFGGFVRKLLENPESEGNSPQKETPEVVRLQELKFGSGEGI
ncbi:MAG: hypothetical protein GY865_00025 [candidate division Zixibacteria bacterium]|nr:hypothetical protein [candidate division Zixibacteria bacterium]